MPDWVNETAALLSDFNTKLADLESKHELLRERVITLGDSFVKNRDRLKKETNSLKDDLREIKNSLLDLHEKLGHLISETENFARKEELRIVEKYMRLWEPLKFARTEEVKGMIDEAIKSIKIGVSKEKIDGKEREDK